MIKEIIYEFNCLPYRQKIPVYGFKFGSNKKSIAVMGALRGDEYQQIFVCALLIKTLKRLEAGGCLTKGTGIMVIPSASQFSMNIGKRFWPLDNTDIDRMFPGYDKGETTQRLAASLFNALRGYKYGVQMASFYIPGDFVPHVRVINTGYQNNDEGLDFGLPYLVIKEPLPIDTTTLNFNWQVFETNTFSLYAKTTDKVDTEAAKETVAAILRFMQKRGFIKGEVILPAGVESLKMATRDLVGINAIEAGLLSQLVKVGDFVSAGQLLGSIYDPYTAEKLEKITAPCPGQLFFARKAQAVAQHETVFFIKPIEQVISL